MAKFPKGSQEAKDYMASIRAKRGSKPKCPCGKSKRKCCCMSGGAIDMPIPPPLPPPPPPSINRVQDFNLNLGLIADPRVRRIMEITQMLFAGRSAVGQVLSQQQTEALVAERAELERQVSQANQPAPAQQGQGMTQSKKVSPEIPRPPVPPPRKKTDHTLEKWIDIMKKWSDDELNYNVDDSYNKMLAKERTQVKRERASGTGSFSSKVGVEPKEFKPDGKDRKMFRSFYKIIYPDSNESDANKALFMITQKDFQKILDFGYKIQTASPARALFYRIQAQASIKGSKSKSNLGSILEDMSGTGGKSSKIVPTNYATETQMATEADDRIGSTEASRNTMAVAVDDAPFASSFPAEEEDTRRVITRIKKDIRELRQLLSDIKRRVAEDQYISPSMRRQNMSLIPQLANEIEELLVMERELLGRLAPSFEVQGTGTKSSKITPSSFATETQMATEADDRIGSTEASRNTMAVAVDDAPLASSYPSSEVPTRDLIKEIQKNIAENQKNIKNIQIRIRNNSFLGGGDFSNAEDLETIDKLFAEIQRDMEFELELLGRLTPSFEVQGTPYFEGTGMKKKRKGKFVKGSQEAKDFMASIRAKQKQKN